MEDLKLNVEVVHKGTVIPSCYENIVSGLYDEEGKFIKFTGRRIYGTNDYLEADKDLNMEEVSEIEYFDEDVIYLGFLRAHWGHFLVDSTIRMWMLQEEKWKNYKLVVTSPDLPEFYYDVFRILGIDMDNVCILDRAAVFRTVYVPEVSYLPGHFMKPEYCDFFLHLSEQVHLNLPIYDKIYFSRTNFVKKNHLLEYGEKQIEDTLIAGGFVVLYPEEMTILEQIHYVHNCKILVTTNGTIAHDILFANDESILVILNRFQEIVENPHQKAINEMKRLHITYVNAYASGSTHSLSKMLLTKEMKSFCREYNINISRNKLRISYIKDDLSYYLRLCKQKLKKGVRGE